MSEVTHRADLFLSHVQVDENGCWLWTGATSPQGYGRFNAGLREDARNVLAHRWSYEHHVGPIPDGLDLDHLCRVRHCVNPEHLEPVTRQENVQRGHRARSAS